MPALHGYLGRQWRQRAADTGRQQRGRSRPSISSGPDAGEWLPACLPACLRECYRLEHLATGRNPWRLAHLLPRVPAPAPLQIDLAALRTDMQSLKGRLGSMPSLDMLPIRVVTLWWASVTGLAPSSLSSMHYLVL